MHRILGSLLRTRRAALASSLLALPLFVVPMAGQAPPTGPSAQDRAAALKQSLAENQKALRQYTWVETTQISLKGEVKKQEQKQAAYGADGKVQKTPLPGAAPAKAEEKSSGGGRRGGGRLKENIIENKVDDMKEYMEKVAALVHEYVPPDAQKIQAAQAAGNLTAQGGILTVKNYVKQGDSLSIGLDTASKKLSSYNVASYVEKPKDDTVTLAVTFAALPDGTSYPQQVLLDVKSKQIQVKVTNGGHKKAGS
jgi:hypothetical protein